MKVIKSSIADRGYKNIKCDLYRLCLEMVSKGLSDLKVVIGSERVDSMRCILMNGNETFRKLLEDAQFSGELVLCEGSSVDGFIEIEKYYSGGSLELNDDNVMKVLLMSIYYNDKEILYVCIKFIRNHLNDELMLRILELSDLIKKEEIFELIRMSEEYLRENGYKYLNNDRLLYKLRIENLRIILENENLIIKDENWLLKVLMKWYKNEIRNIENEEEKKELKEEYNRMILKSIHFESLRMNEIEKEILSELENIEMRDYLEEISNKRKYRKLNDFSIEDERIKEIIMEYYKDEEEDIIREEDLRKLKSENVISVLLNSQDIKMKEIGILIMIESGIKYKISNKMKREMLYELIGDYKKEDKNSRKIKCLCFFVNDEEYLNTMKCLCGNRILFEILNYSCYYSEESRKLLMKCIDKSNEEEDEDEEMEKIIKNEKIIEELKTKEIISFSYPKEEYLFPIDKEISIIPSFDGNRCEFSIFPPLPSGITIDKESGIINGKVDREIEKKEYEITCKNVRNEKKFKISLDFSMRYTELNKSDGISISSNGKIIEQTSLGGIHCYLNLKLEKGIYHIKIKYLKKGSTCYSAGIFLGLSTNNTYSGEDICNQSTTCNYWARDGKSQDVTQYCHIGTVVNSNPNFKNCGEGSIYEMIVDMNKREFWISHNNSSPVLLVKDLPSPLYSYSSFMCCTGNKHELLSVSHQN